MFEERIVRGVATLDGEAPAWRDHVNAEALHMMNSGDCVLGQIGQALGWGRFWRVLDRFDWDSEDAASRGFVLNLEEQQSRDYDYLVDALNAEWQVALRETPTNETTEG
jgi:hypothetical protein